MADLKISQLTGATTPLAGTEVLPIVQSSSTKKVAVGDLTAGRTVSMNILNAASSAQIGTVAQNETHQYLISNWDGVNVFVTRITADYFGKTRISTALIATGSDPALGTYTEQIELQGGNLKIQNGNLVIGTAGKGVQFANTTLLETVVASYKKSASTTIAAGTGRTDQYFFVDASKTFTITPTGLGGLVTIVNGSAGEACTFFWSWNSATILILGNGGTTFAATSTPGSGQLGIFKSAFSSVLSFKTAASFSAGNVSVCLIGDYASATTDPA